MRPVFTAVEMRALDARALEELGIPGFRLMESAGRGAAAVIARAFAPIRGKRLVVVCGKGNNGGDGFVVARHLKGKGARVEAWLVGRRDEVKGDAAQALTRWRGRVHELMDDRGLPALRQALARADVVVDALLGTGAKGPARGLMAQTIETLNASGRPVASLDLPSGAGSDTGALQEPTVRARITATFAGLKRSLVEYPAAEHAGHVIVVPIGIPEVEVGRGIDTFLVEEADVRLWFPPRPRDAHKGTYGHLLVLAGSLGKTGAAALAGRAALRSGAGLCTVAVPASQQPVVASLGLEYMSEALPETLASSLAPDARGYILASCSRMDAVAIGPGISPDLGTQALVRALVAEVPRPMVLDADALGALAGHLDLLAKAPAPRLLTPHPGEMARMLGRTVADVQRDRVETVRAFCRAHGVFLVLKGAASVIGAPDGRVFINPTGNPGMASGGSGDVLTGMIGAFLARQLGPLEALIGGVYLHGRAGDLARDRVGEEGLIAGDIIETIPTAMRRLSGTDQPSRGGT
jgi:NAD(P)H-hydrate epimerase